MIKVCEIYTVQAPMGVRFAHAARSRSVTESVIVRLSGGGVTAWGEGAPRRYVTGETLESAVAAIGQADLEGLSRRIRWSCLGTAIQDIAEVGWGERISNGRERAPAAAAALELAFVDLACRLHCANVRSLVEQLLPADVGVSVSDFPVSTVIGLSGDPAIAVRSKTGETLHHVKLKVPPDPAQAVQEVAAARAVLGDAIPLSVDANGSWTFENVAPVAEHLRALAWIEEPLAPRDWAGLAQLRERYGLTVMLDESAVAARDVREAVRAGACDAVNVRISKCGGLCAAIEMVRLCRELAVGFQVGVQVGEIGPLWAAGRALAACTPDALAVEAGRQDEWFETPYTVPPFAIDRAANRATATSGPGLGIVPSSELLQQHLRPETRRSLR